MQCVCVCSVCVGCMVMQSAQQQVKRRVEEKRGEKRGERRREEESRRGGEQPINKNKRTKEERESKVREASTKTEKQKNQKSSGAIAPCVAVSEAFNWRRQRCFCRQRSYQRDHARSRPIAEAKPVWARSVLPWVTRWESRVMLLTLSFSS